LVEPELPFIEPQLQKLLADGPPWEHRERVGIFFGLSATIRYFLQKPLATFALMHRQGRMGEALLFIALLQLFVLVVNVALARLSGEPPLPPEMISLLGGEAFLRWLPWIMVAGLGLSLLIKASSIFIALRLMGEVRYPWSTAFRIVAYADGVSSLFGLLPLVGGFLQLFFSFFLLINGLKVIYGLSRKGVLGALFLSLGLGIIMTLGVASLVALFFVPAAG